ncbi:PMU1 [[Candida] subhashii]|uniref:PMU1 n=1 Tax=[Candida] subhashii TaxID=561895 RepID=A0A8J5UXF8_9ASCO|nr:PMU1 [[Candida] subhashii]KAG7663605.1 PMU1 [[Candida] subhashii]
MTKQSLLVPTQDDYDDAHADTEAELKYHETFRTFLKDEKDENGNWVYPWSFEVVQGFFKQSDPATNDLKFNYAWEHMGRLKSWEDIISELKELNDNANENESYKLIFCARHGQGYHNLIVQKYGIQAWIDKYHALSTDGEYTWAPDPNLTETGVKQSEENNELWKQELSLGAPMPSKFFVSPMQRSSRTFVNTWDDIKPKDVHPVVKEKIRETLGKNLCDQRSPKRVIDERFGKYGFITDELVEEDIYFTETRETMVEQSIRVNQFVQELFESDVTNGIVDKEKKQAHTFISTTSHAGTIRCFINVFQHRHFTISTGGMIPIVVKATRRSD